VKSIQQELVQRLQQAQEQVEALTQQAQEQALSLKQQGGQIHAEYQALAAQLIDTRSLASEVETLTTKVERIEEKIRIDNTSNVTTEQEQRIGKSISEFRSYLQKIGFKLEGGQINVQIFTKGWTSASYNGINNTIMLSESVVDDTDVIFREYTYHALLSVVNWASIQIIRKYEELNPD
jgi:hypothetical protein